MNANLKIFLLWLLVFALPVQGFAAVPQPVCATPVHLDGAALTIAPAGAAQAADPGGNDRHHSPAAGHDGASSSSSGCQQCCASAGILPSGVNWLLPHRPRVQPEAAPERAFSGHISSGLERPPRSITI